MQIFEKTILRLAGLYLLIIMSISIFFSIALYRVSVDEVVRDFRRQGDIISQLPDFRGMAFSRERIMAERQKLIEESKDRILGRLIATNVIILVGEGILSYYLARRTLQPIQEAHEAQSRFTADASHELRTPIAIMQSEIEVALMNPKLTLADAKARLSSNLEELAKLTTLSEGLLRLARLENSDLQLEKVQLGDLLDKSVARVLPLAEKKKILIKKPDKITNVVAGDMDSLGEAIVILLDNAVKYSPEKTEVTVSVRKENRHILLQIKDKGIGIKASELPHIFERFYRADSARSKQKTNGYGLGLAIAKNIIEKHHGSISATSSPGKGAVFTLRLPSA